MKRTKVAKKVKAKVKPAKVTWDEDFDARSAKAGDRRTRMDVNFYEAFLIAFQMRLLAKDDPCAENVSLSKRALAAYELLGGQKADLEHIEKEERSKMKKSA